MSDFQTILVPHDFSGHAEAALELALDLAERLEGRIHVVHVVQTPAFAYGFGTYAGAVVLPPSQMEELRTRATEAVQELVAAIRRKRQVEVEAHVIEGIAISDVICDLGEKIGADLIVMGTHGRSGLAHAFLGSVAERTLRKAGCPVLTVRGSEEEDDQG